MYLELMRDFGRSERAPGGIDGAVHPGKGAQSGQCRQHTILPERHYDIGGTGIERRHRSFPVWPRSARTTACT